MIIYDILLILQYQVSTTVMDLVAVFALFVFMLALLCFFLCCYRIFWRIKIYIYIIAKVCCNRLPLALSANYQTHFCGR